MDNPPDRPQLSASPELARFAGIAPHDPHRGRACSRRGKNIERHRFPSTSPATPAFRLSLSHRLKGRLPLAVWGGS
jgi:hypothetical protein